MSSTDLSDLSIVGTCDILVYQMHGKVMGFVRLVDSTLLQSASSHVTEMLL